MSIGSRIAGFRQGHPQGKDNHKKYLLKTQIDLFYFLKKPCYNRIIKENGTEPAVRPQGSSRNEKLEGMNYGMENFTAPGNHERGKKAS